jgi:hypothetical protein
MHDAGRVTPAFGRRGVLVPARAIIADRCGCADVNATRSQKDPIEQELGYPQSDGHKHCSKANNNRDRAKISEYIPRAWSHDTKYLTCLSDRG